MKINSILAAKCAKTYKCAKYLSSNLANKCNVQKPYDVNFAGYYDECVRYKNLLIDRFFPYGELDMEIVNFLNNLKLTSDSTDSSIQEEKTIEEILQDSVIEDGEIDEDMFHSTFVLEDAINIMKNGFDPLKIARTKVGPGFYFSGSEGEARMFNSCLLKARIQGRYARMKYGYYDKILCPELKEKLRYFLGLDAQNDIFLSAQIDVINKIINEYTRNAIMYDLGYDVTFSGCRDGCYCVVHNKDVISELKIY